MAGWLRTAVFGALLALLFALPVRGAAYFDDMEASASDQVRAFHNLSPVALSGGGSRRGLYDKTYVSFSSTAQLTGRVTYTARGCEEITVGIYTQTGTFAHRAGGELLLGFPESGKASAARPGGAQRALFSASRNSLYTTWDGSLRQAAFLGYYAFEDPASLGQPPSVPEDLIPFGVNVYASRDGSSFTRITLRYGMVDHKADTHYCYEELTGSIPGGTTVIVVEINDTDQYYDLSTKRFEHKTPAFMTSLASVTLTGQNLETGPPAPPVVATEPPSESAQPTAPTGETKPRSSSRPAKEDEEEEEGETKASGRSSKSSAAKFEGVIITGGESAPPTEKPPSSSGSSQEARSSTAKAASSRQSSSRKSGAASSSQSSAAPSTAEEAATELAAGEREVVYYQAPGGENGRDGFTAGVTGYIIAVFGVIVFLMLRSGKK